MKQIEILNYHLKMLDIIIFVLSFFNASQVALIDYLELDMSIKCLLLQIEYIHKYNISINTCPNNYNIESNQYKSITGKKLKRIQIKRIHGMHMMELKTTHCKCTWCNLNSNSQEPKTSNLSNNVNAWMDGIYLSRFTILTSKISRCFEGPDLQSIIEWAQPMFNYSTLESKYSISIVVTICVYKPSNYNNLHLSFTYPLHGYILLLVSRVANQSCNACTKSVQWRSVD